MKDIRCLFGFHNYKEYETKTIYDYKGYSMKYVNMRCLRCSKPYQIVVTSIEEKRKDEEK